jgi:uncharacterized RDD family membrane protein YckC
MNNNSQFVSPVKRLAATIYDFFLLLGVWFGCGSIALWLNDGQILHPAIGAIIVLVSAWGFYSFFWIKGGRTLGMAAWNIKIRSSTKKSINLIQTTKRFIINIVIVFTLGLPLLQIYFSKDKKALNDKLSGTELTLG